MGENADIIEKGEIAENAAIFDKRHSYVISGVRDTLNLNNVSTNNPQLDAFLRDWHQPNRKTPTHIHRLTKLIKSTKSVVLLDLEYICSAFKMERNGISVIYAILFSVMENGEIVHKYILYGPTFISQDGEYRHRFIPYHMFQERINSDEYLEMFEIVQTYILSEIKKGIYIPFVDYFIRDIKHSHNIENKLKKSIADSRLAIDLFALAWTVDFTRAKLKLTENHINKLYMRIVCNIKNVKANAVYDILVKKYNITELYKKIIIFSHITTCRMRSIITPEVGIKIIPIKIQEGIEGRNIHHDLWREWYLMQKCANLMLNFVSPTFPYMYGWFAIHGIDARLFDNESMYEKFIQSGIADEITASLRDGEHYTNTDGIYVNSRFHQLSDKIKQAGTYGDTTIRLAPAVFCAVQEHVSITLGDTYKHRKHRPTETKWLRDYFMDVNVFKKQMFEFMYGFYCLNSRLSVVHGDLHLNNATLYPLLNYYKRKTDPKNDATITPNPEIMYIVHNDIFLFPQTGIVSVIIDMSRAMFGDHDKIAEEYDDVFAEVLLRKQHKFALRVIERSYPDMMETHGDSVKKLIENNFELFFRIFSVLDMLNLSRRLRLLYETVDVKMDKKNINAFLLTIETEAEKIFLTKLEDAIDGRITKIEDMPWPNYTLMHKIYPDNALCKHGAITPAGKKFNKNQSEHNVIDVFNQSAPIKYNVDTIRSHPPYFNLSAERKFIMEPKPESELAKAVAVDVNLMVKFDRIDKSIEIDKIHEESAARTFTV